MHSFPRLGTPRQQGYAVASSTLMSWGVAPCKGRSVHGGRTGMPAIGRGLLYKTEDE